MNRLVLQLRTAPPEHLARFFSKRVVTKRCGGVEAYIFHLLLCFRAVRRVLRDDGVCWVVLGDSFAASGKGRANPLTSGLAGGWDSVNASSPCGRRQPRTGYKSGDLLGVPWRFAFAAQADGWTLRNDVAWAKRAPLPESIGGTRWQRCRVKAANVRTTAQPHAVGVNDGRRDNFAGGLAGTPSTIWSSCPGCAKCSATGGYVLRRGSWRHTRAVETIYMLTKGGSYWANQEAVREKDSGQNGAAVDFRRATKEQLIPSQSVTQHRLDREHTTGTGTRNPRNFLLLGPSPFRGAHFAAYPPALVEPLLRATCPAKCCAVCGAAWAPVVERTSVEPKDYEGKYLDTDPQSAGRRMLANVRARRENGEDHDQPFPAPRILGYRPTCEHADAPSVPGTVLDPFAGSGTTLLVADRLGLSATGIDVAPTYRDMQRARVTGDAPLFAAAAVREE